MKKYEMKNYCRKKILMLVAGGTGGHIYPSLSLINKMKDYNFIIITEQRGNAYYKKYLRENTLNFKIHTHKVTSPSNRKLIFRIVSSFQILISLVKSLLIILFEKPNAVIGFGGYPSVAPILAAKICNVPSIIHEQNAIIGRANKLLSKISNKLALSFVNTKNIKNINNTIYNGNPVRQEFEEIGNIDYIKSISNKPFTILIFGGSLGATFFSKQLTPIICSLPEEIKKEIKIIQQARKEEIEIVKNNYRSHEIDAEVSSFFQNIPQKFKLANLIITRSGGSAVAEVLASCRPAIFIPLPSSFDNHQLENAKFFERNKCGWVFDQINDSKNDFRKLIQDIFKNPEKLIKVNLKIKKLSKALSKLRNDKTSAEFLSDLILKMTNNYKKEIKNLC